MPKTSALDRSATLPYKSRTIVSINSVERPSQQNFFIEFHSYNILQTHRSNKNDGHGGIETFKSFFQKKDIHYEKLNKRRPKRKRNWKLIGLIPLICIKSVFMQML